MFRRLAFGYNDEKASDTGVAVAYGLILNYLDQTVNGRVLPNILKAEILQGSAWDAQRYPQTALLHSCLLRYGHLKPGLLGLWGRGVVRRLRRFWRVNSWQLGTIVRSVFGGYSTRKTWRLIKREIDSSRPVMAITTYRRLEGKRRLYHTMVVCGYRVDSHGRREILVHTGRYGNHIKGSRAQLLYIPLKHVICSYLFDVAFLPSAL